MVSGDGDQIKSSNCDLEQNDLAEIVDRIQPPETPVLVAVE
jgi:hypothetical protein